MRHAETKQDGEVDTSGVSNGYTVRPRLWYLIPARFAGLTILVLASPLLVVEPYLPAGIAAIANLVTAALFVVAVGLYLVSFLAPLAIYVERNRLGGARWRPAFWYYIIAVPGSLVAIPLAMLYTYRRLERVGFASTPQKL